MDTYLILLIEDPFEEDSFAINAEILKTGAPARSERTCKVIIIFLEEPSQSEDEEIFDMLLKSDSAFEFLKSEQEDIYSDADLIERFESMSSISEIRDSRFM